MTRPRRITRWDRRRFLAGIVAIVTAAPIAAQERSPDFSAELRAAQSLANRIRPLWLEAAIAAEDLGFRDRPVAASRITSTVAGLLIASATPGLSQSQRKAQSIGTTLMLGMRASHDQVLCLLLQHAFFGRNSVGHDTAARVYFLKGADELDLPQIALIAGLIGSPARDSVDAAIARDRRDTVLRQMHRLGSITGSELQRALDEPLDLPR